MKRMTIGFLMALGLLLPAMSFAQDDDRRPVREGQPGKRDMGPGARRGRDTEGSPELADRDFRPPRDGARGRGEPKGEDRPGRRMLPPSPLFAALDANHDGVIDAKEIEHAARALRRLDRDGDGEVTLEEIRPGRPEREPMMPRRMDRREHDRPRRGSEPRGED